jgi:hypothetical protein
MFEPSHEGESPIADPDLAMVAPDLFTESDAPQLCEHNLPTDVLQSLYHDAAHQLLEPFHTS